MRAGAVRGAHRAPGRRRGLLAVVLVAVLALLATAVTQLVRGDDGAAPGSARGPAGDPLAPAAGEMAGWIEGELPADATVGAPEDLRTVLVDAGVPDGRLGPGDAGGLQVVEGDPPEDAVVVARFPDEGSGSLTVVESRPGGPTAEELDRRQRLAAAVLANPVAGATGRAAEVLRAAEVDARLLGLVAVLVTRLDVGIADLPPAPGQPARGTLVRRVLLGSAGGEELAPGSEAVERVRAFLGAQQPPFAPDVVEVTADGVLVGFDYSPTPDAEVSAAA